MKGSYICCISCKALLKVSDRWKEGHMIECTCGFITPVQEWRIVVANK